MDAILRTLATLVSCGIVLVIAVWAIHAVMGEWVTLLYAALGFSALMAVMRRVNA